MYKTDKEFKRSINNAISKIDNGRLFSGCLELFSVYENCQYPLYKIVVSYDLGAVFWDRIGIGNKAKEFYQNVIYVGEKYGADKVELVFPTMIAKACENLMLLSISYEEYYKWAEKLRVLQPNADILRSMVLNVREYQERGFSWYQTLIGIALESCDRSSHAKNRGEYARALATYQLILLNRRTMRLLREDWSNIVNEYATLALQVCLDSKMKMKFTNKIEEIKEVSIVSNEALLFVEEYFSLNPSDKIIESLLIKIKRLVNYKSGNVDQFENTFISPSRTMFEITEINSSFQTPSLDIYSVSKEESDKIFLRTVTLHFVFLSIFSTLQELFAWLSGGQSFLISLLMTFFVCIIIPVFLFKLIKMARSFSKTISIIGILIIIFLTSPFFTSCRFSEHFLLCISNWVVFFLQILTIIFQLDYFNSGRFRLYMKR